MTVSTGTLNEKLKSNSLCTDAPPPSLTPLTKESGRETTSLCPIFFLREAGWGASVHRQKSNHYRIDQSASGSYSNTVLRRLNSWAIVTKTSLLFLFLYIPSAVSLIFPRGIAADEVKSAKLRSFKVQKFRKNQICATRIK